MKSLQTEFQRKKKLRDAKIVREFHEMEGATTAKINDLSRKYGPTPNMVYKILKKHR